MNYYDTFIQVAPDCPVKLAVAPVGRTPPTIPEIEYALLHAQPYTFTQEELLFTVHMQRQGIGQCELKVRRDAMWKEFFSKSRACLRASLLPKKYGWGLHFDAEGRIALVARESAAYRSFASGEGGVIVLTALRSKKG